MKQQTSLKSVAVLSTLIGGASVVVIAVWIVNNIGLFEQPWMTFETLPQKTLNADGTTPLEGTLAKVKPGDALPTLVRRCNHTNIARSYIVTRYLECAHSEMPLPIAPNLAFLPVGCSTVAGRANIIPINAPVDQCRIAGNAELQGRVKTFIVPFSTEWFQVAAK